MTLAEIARALGVQTLDESVAEVARDTGLPESEVRALVNMDLARPTLMLDYRGGEDAGNRWDKLAKPPLADLAEPLDLDPWTGLPRGGRS